MTEQINIEQEDKNVLFSVLHTYPEMVEDDAYSKRFNKELKRLKERISDQLWTNHPTNSK